MSSDESTTQTYTQVIENLGIELSSGDPTTIRQTLEAVLTMSIAVGGSPPTPPSFPHAALTAILTTLPPDSDDTLAVCKVITLLARASHPRSPPTPYWDFATAALQNATDWAPVAHAKAALEILSWALPLLPEDDPQWPTWCLTVWSMLGHPELPVAAAATRTLLHYARQGSSHVLSTEGLHTARTMIDQDGPESVVSLRVLDALVALAGLDPQTAPVVGQMETSACLGWIFEMLESASDLMVQLNLVEILVAAVDTAPGASLLNPGPQLDSLAGVARGESPSSFLLEHLLRILAPRAHVLTDPHTQVLPILANLVHGNESSSESAALGFAATGWALSSPQGVEYVLASEFRQPLAEALAEAALAPLHSGEVSGDLTCCALHALGAALDLLPDDAARTLFDEIISRAGGDSSTLLTRREEPFTGPRVAIYTFYTGAVRSAAGRAWAASAPGFYLFLSNVGSDSDKPALAAKQTLVDTLVKSASKEGDDGLVALFGSQGAARIHQLHTSGVLTPAPQTSSSSSSGPVRAMEAPVTRSG